MAPYIDTSGEDPGVYDVSSNDNYGAIEPQPWNAPVLPVRRPLYFMHIL